MALNIGDVLQQLKSICSTTGVGFETHIIRDFRNSFLDKGRFPRVFVQCTGFELLRTDGDKNGVGTYQITVYAKSEKDPYGENALLDAWEYATELHDTLTGYVWVQQQGRVDGISVMNPLLDKANKVWIQGITITFRMYSYITT